MEEKTIDGQEVVRLGEITLSSSVTPVDKLIGLLRGLFLDENVKKYLGLIEKKKATIPYMG